MSYGFIKKPELLEETHIIDDLFDFSDLVEEFDTKVSKIKKSGLVGVIGEFGSGKSTMLYQYEKKKNNDFKFINFDAWKYPERGDLWEGFVLDVADHLGDKKRVTKKLDGKNSASKIVDIITDIAGAVRDVLGDLQILDKFIEIFKSSPAKRVFEIQEILSKLLSEVDKDICIIVEDIDRSGDRGIYFLETLKHFLKSNNNDKKIIVVVLIGKENYVKDEKSYIKSLDYIHYFEPYNLEFKTFVKEIFDLSSITSANEQIVIGQISNLLGKAAGKYKLSIRKIKNLVRNINMDFLCLDKGIQSFTDARVYIGLAFAKKLNDTLLSYNNSNIMLNTKDTEWVREFFASIALNYENMESVNMNRCEVQFVEGDKAMNYKKPRLLPSNGRDVCILSDNYITILDIRS